MTRPHSIFLFSVVTCAMLGFAVTANAQVNEAPNAHFLFGSDVFADGQSNNLGPAAQMVLEEGMYWFEGDCPDSSGSYRDCDLLRFGASVYPRQCSGVSPAEVARAVDASEDGGDDVQGAVQHLQDASDPAYCDSEPSYRPLDEALDDHQTDLFDGTESSGDSAWERPNLNLLVISDLPQSHDESDVSGHAVDARARGAIDATCRLLEGESASVGGQLPAMPTWVMMARRHEAAATTYGGLLAAAGGTGQCCHDPNGDCDPQEPADQMAVCDEIDDFDEVALREAIADDEFRCAPGASQHQTGSLDYGERSKGTLPHILCHLAGEDGHANCTGPKSGDAYRRPTNVLEKMSCVRQVPDDYDGGPLEVCDRFDDCELIEVCDAGGGPDCDATFIDPNETLIAVSGEDSDGDKLCESLAQGGYVQPGCPQEGERCTVDEREDGVDATGRCSVGQIVCDEEGEESCEALYDPMPEICNGLDDDCDGAIDNLSTSWDDFEDDYDPTDLEEYDSDGVDRSGVHCYERDVCSCPEGPMDHGGPGFDEHVTNWEPGTCQCGQSLSDDTSGEDDSSAPDTPAQQPQSSCASGMSGAASLWTILIVTGLWAACRRRDLIGAVGRWLDEIDKGVE